MSVRSKLTRRLIVELQEQGNNITDMASLVGVSRRCIYDWLEKDQGAQTHHITTLIKLTGIDPTEEEEAIL